MKKIVVWPVLLALCILAAGCGTKTPAEMGAENVPTENTTELIVVGFSQLGAESDWRSANTESMRQTFTIENGYQLIFENGQQKQENQIMAIRKFIQQEVDYIVLAPVVETGWDTVLQEAKDAGIPVILVDRRVDVSDDSLFTCWVGSDFELEGKKAAEWLKQFTLAKGIDPADLHIVNIQGTIGATAQIGRTKGLVDAEKANGWDLMAQVSGDFTQAKGREAMESLLKQYDNINVVYCENDNEAFGVIEAIEAAGKKVGSDITGGEIMVISFDGVKEAAMEFVAEDKISCIVACNPLQGSHVRSIIESLEDGVMAEKFSYVEEEMYAHDKTVEVVTVDAVEYPVIVVPLADKRRQKREVNVEAALKNITGIIQDEGMSLDDYRDERLKKYGCCS